MLAVCTAETVCRPSRPVIATVHRPSGPTVVVRSPALPATDTETEAPGKPVPVTGPIVGRSVVTDGGTTTSEAGALDEPSAGSLPSVTVKTCCGPERTVAMHDHAPEAGTVAVHPVDPVAAGPATRTRWPGVPRPCRRTVAVVTSPGSAMVGRTAGRSEGRGVGVPVPGGRVPNCGNVVGDGTGVVVAAAADALGAPSRTVRTTGSTAARAAARAPAPRTDRRVDVRGRRTGPSATAPSSTLSPSVFTGSIPRDLAAMVNPPHG